MDPVFLTLAEVLEIHRDQIARYGGATGIRDLGILRSAVGVPMATIGGEYLHPDICEMAAAYLFHLVQYHPFVDGNKRTGAAATCVFLYMNKMELDAPPDKFSEAVLAVARGDWTKSDVAVFLRAHARKF